MKLAEALLNRGALQDKLSDLRRRLNSSAIVQEGEEPAEAPAELLKQMETCLSEWQKLVLQINLTNAQTVVAGQTLTALLAQRDMLREKVSVYRDFLSCACDTGRRARGSEIKLTSTVTVKELQKTVDAQAQALRKLDIKIQEINWTTELRMPD